MASKRVEVGIVTFGPVQVVTEFQTADVFNPPTLVTTGDTPIGAAIENGPFARRAAQTGIPLQWGGFLSPLDFSYHRRWSHRRVERGGRKSEIGRSCKPF